MSIPILELEHVSRTFTVRRGLLGSQALLRAVDDVSVSLDAGESLGLVGESGCGKSTLGRMAVGLLSPSAGKIRLAGVPLRAAHDRRSGADAEPGRLQMVFQDPYSSLNPRLPVGMSVGEPLAARGMSGPQRKENVAEMLRLVGLTPEHGRRFPHEFSGGQRQRLAVARALITRPDVVVCDEPVSALDASVQAQVLNLLRDVQERFGPAYLFISHDLAVVGFMCRRILVMYLGKLVEEAPREALFDAPAHPYTQALLASMPSRDPGQRTPPAVLSGELPSPLKPPTGCAFHPRCARSMDICRREMPPWVTLEEGRRARCHLYTGVMDRSGITA